MFDCKLLGWNMKNICCNDYVFVYKDSHNIWNFATSLSFVAKHTYCRAIYKSEVEKHFGDAKNMLKLINTNSTLTSTQKEVLVWNEIQ